MTISSPILVVGQLSNEHLGFHFKTALSELGLPGQFLDYRSCKSSFEILNKIWWRLFDKSYVHQESFQKRLQSEQEIASAKTVFVLGNSPVTQKTLLWFKSNQVKTINFLADDPWNTKISPNWFLNSLPLYDLLITPRKANLSQLQQLSSGKVIYLPFGYNPQIHFEDSKLTPEEEQKYSCDVMFFGGADPDRVPYIIELIRAGFNLKLYGGYWDRYPETKPYSRGIISPEELRKAIKASKVVLNLVRRANRDGHVMRSFEGPAMGGCMLNEFTEEHLEIFGSSNTLFFQNSEEMVKHVKALISSSELRTQITQSNSDRIVKGKNTYTDRLKVILEHLAKL